MDPGAGTVGIWFAPQLRATLAMLGPLGALRLDETRMFFVEGGPLDAAGRSTFHYTVPADPALVGLDVCFQAVVGDPSGTLRLTNAVRDRIPP